MTLGYYMFFILTTAGVPIVGDSRFSGASAGSTGFDSAVLVDQLSTLSYSACLPLVPLS